MMGPAERNRELIAGLAPHRAGLGESKMVGVSRASAANNTRLRRNKFEMSFIAMPTRLTQREFIFLDFGGGSVGLKRR